MKIETVHYNLNSHHIIFLHKFDLTNGSNEFEITLVYTQVQKKRATFDSDYILTLNVKFFIVINVI